LQITLRVCKIVHAKFEILSCGSNLGQLNVLLLKDVIWNNVCQFDSFVVYMRLFIVNNLEG
jgi:hypothetical protein